MISRGGTDVAILENIEDTLSISLYEDQVVGSVHDVKLCKGPSKTPYLLPPDRKSVV